jgi:hypothetical protein
LESVRALAADHGIDLPISQGKAQAPKNPIIRTNHKKRGSHRRPDTDNLVLEINLFHHLKTSKLLREIGHINSNGYSLFHINSEK